MQTQSLFRQPHFLRFWAGQAISQLGSLVGRLALPFFVIFSLHASATQVAWLRVCELVPGIVLGLLAGVWVDRLKRRNVMMLSDVVRALLVGSIPFMLLFQQAGWLQILLVAAVVSVFSVTFDSAYGAYLPSLVEPDQITSANTKLSATSAVSEVIGFSLSGALFAWLGGAITLSLDAVSFLVSALSLLSIRKPEKGPESREHQQPVAQELARGLRYLGQNKTLSMLAGISGIQNVFYGISGTVYMLYISRSLHVSPTAQGLLYAVGGIGAFATAAVADALFRRVGFGKSMLLVSACGIIGAAFLPFATGPMWLILAFVFVQQLLGDGADTVFEIGVAAYCQAQTEDAFLGRVHSIWRVITSLCLLLGTVLGGVLAAGVGLRRTLFIAIFIRIAGLALSALSRLQNVVSVEERAKA